MKGQVLGKTKGKPGEKGITENNRRECQKGTCQKNVTEPCFEAVQTSTD